MMRLTLLIASLMLISAPNFTYGALSESDKQTFSPKNKLDNSGAENGLGRVSATGVNPTRNTTSAHVLSGNASFSWDSGSAGQIFSWGSVASKPGNYTALVWVKAATGTATHLLEVFDGSNVISSTTIVSSTTNFVQTAITFSIASSVNLSVRVKSVAADEPLIYMDDALLDRAENVNISQVNQAVLYGTLKNAGTANCVWTSAATTFTDVAADTDCPAPTVTGSVTAPATKVLGLVVQGPGKFLIHHSGNRLRTDSAGNGQTRLRLSDGTNNSTEAFVPTISASGFSRDWGSTQTYYIDIPESGSRTLTVQVDTAGGNFSIDNESEQDGVFVVERFPTTSETALRPNQLANSWSGYHATNCSWTVTSATYADFSTDASCDLTQRVNNNFGTVTGTNTGPQITYTPSRAGTYLVCTGVTITNGTAGSDLAWKITDGTTDIATSGSIQPASSGSYGLSMERCGLYKANSTSAVTLKVQAKASAGTITLGTESAQPTIEWSILQIDQQLPAPLLANAVTTPSAGVEYLGRANFANSTTTTAECTASPCTVNNQSGSWLTGVTRSSQGVYVGTMTGFSAKPICLCTSSGAIAGRWPQCNATSATNLDILGFNSVAGADDIASNIICMGPK